MTTYYRVGIIVALVLLAIGYLVFSANGPNNVVTETRTLTELEIFEKNWLIVDPLKDF